MKVLVIGSGGREHAIAYALSKSSKVSEILKLLYATTRLSLMK